MADRHKKTSKISHTSKFTSKKNASSIQPQEKCPEASMKLESSYEKSRPEGSEKKIFLKP
uniref:Uncharacterized protein n=1 Tax=Cucumis melo TaxID=3656 RepID=A0A9I9DSE9_CUCME